MDFDVIAVGGGIAGSTLALVLARHGVRVLVLEKERRFRDRVRGEAILPWGVDEARDLELYDLLIRSGGRPIRFWTSHSWKQRPPRDLGETTPRGSPCINFFHPDMQEALLGAAEEAGASVRRGVRVEDVHPGSPPAVTVRCGTRSERLAARLVVGAGGRALPAEAWGAFEMRRDPERLAIAGVLLEGTATPERSEHVFRDSAAGEGALLFPMGPGRTRTYFIYRSRGERRGLSGDRRVAAFVESCVRTGVPRDWLADARSAGPLAEFDGADRWVPQPYREGVALIGDAAGSNDPAWGNGLSLVLRDVRTLKDALLANGDWERAGHAYARVHDRDCAALRRVTGWLADLLYEIGPEADARRERAFALMKEDRSRNPDYIALGPESPSDETARRRMFGEA